MIQPVHIHEALVESRAVQIQHSSMAVWRQPVNRSLKCSELSAPVASYHLRTNSTEDVTKCRRPALYIRCLQVRSHSKAGI